MIRLESAEATEDLGVRLGRVLRTGDLLLLSGDLGAGKTTLMRGVGQGLGVRGAVTSPTFVLSRRHPSTTGGPALVHVDAYRLGSADELLDLDLQSDLEDAVVAVEWGVPMGRELADEWLEIDLAENAGGRLVRFTAHGPRWQHREAPWD